MVEVAGRPILHHQLDALSRARASTTSWWCAATAAISSTAAAMPLRFVENPEWQNNNILASLLYAADEMEPRLRLLLLGHRVRRRRGPPAGRGGRQHQPDAAAALVDRPALAGRLRGPHPAPDLRGRAGPGATGDGRGRPGGPGGQAGGRPRGRPSASSSAWPGSPPRAAGPCARSGSRRWPPAGWTRPSGGPGPCASPTSPTRSTPWPRPATAWLPVFIDGLWREIDTGQDLAAAETGRRRLALRPAGAGTAAMPDRGSRPLAVPAATPPSGWPPPTTRSGAGRAGPGPAGGPPGGDPRPPGRRHGRSTPSCAWPGADRPAWGRSYMEHVVALAATMPSVPREVRAAAGLLRDTPPAGPGAGAAGRARPPRPSTPPAGSSTGPARGSDGARQLSRNG